MTNSEQSYTYHNREISWLAFNHRVLQEATNADVPLYERLKFLSIYHTNLDEFFRVRMAAIKSMANLKSKHRKKLSFVPKDLLKELFAIADEQYATLDKYFYNKLIPELAKNGIKLLNNEGLSEQQHEYVTDYAQNNILPFVQPSLIEKDKIMAFLKNRALYMAVLLRSKEDNSDVKYAYVEIPDFKVKRFIPLPDEDEKTHSYMLLDDAVRALLPQIFYGYNVEKSYSFMLNRDAELYIDDEYSGNLVEKIRKSLAKRDVGVPVGFIYDLSMPKKLLSYLTEAFNIENDALIKGSKYLKMGDFISFPNPFSPELEDSPLPPLPHKYFEKYDSPFDAVKARDRLLNFPYQRFDYVFQLIRLAATDERVTHISITLYRTSKKSKVAKALIAAAKNGKEVTAFIEVKARFDEKSNMKWARQMEDAGVNVIYSLPLLKVHSKLLLITRQENQSTIRYAYLGTGNFNSASSKIYTDHALITSDKNITNEVQIIFDILSGTIEDYEFEHLLVAPNHMRTEFIRLIDYEIAQAEAGKKAEIFVKQNSIEDKQMINKLYEASNAGVRIRMIVRGICCLVAGVEGQSENIEVRSIVDRFLEHARVYRFYHGGEDLIYLSSADWMKRNLSRRIEVAAPVRHDTLKGMIDKILELQWQDNIKSRLVDEHLKNEFILSTCHLRLLPRATRRKSIV